MFRGEVSATAEADETLRQSHARRAKQWPDSGLGRYDEQKPDGGLRRNED